MNKDLFWQWIEVARTEADGDLEAMVDVLQYRLSGLSVEDIMMWKQIFDEYQRLSYKEKLWAAAYVMNGGCSDDAFDYFRGWLTAQGKTVFLEALRDPDSLAEYEEAREDETECEDMLSVACGAYFAKLGELPDYAKFYKVLNQYPLTDELKKELASEVVYADDMDKTWEEDALEPLLPRLCEKFDWQDAVEEEVNDEMALKDVSGLSLEEKIAYWHMVNQHKRIIEEIETLPQTAWTYDLTGVLARAYNNNDNYQKAIEILERVKEQGEQDPLWLFRYAYALYYLYKEEKALQMFEQCKAINPEEEDVDEFIEACRREIKEKEEAGNQGVTDAPEIYSEEEMDAVENHIATCFGAYDNVFHEVVSPDIHVDICIINPTEERNYYTLVTMGMGAHKMNIPEELKDRKLERAEILVTLPPDWEIQSEEETWYWPIRWLKILARLPINNDTWLGWGHTVPNGGPFAKNTKLSTVLLTMPYLFGSESSVCVLPDGDEINFYQMLPLYEEECDYKISDGVEALERCFPDNFNMVLDINRKNYRKKDQGDGRRRMKWKH